MKGLAIMTTVILVLGVVLLFVVVPRMFGIENIASAFDPLGYKKKLSSLGTGDDLERAIECAQARCFANDRGKEGCGYLKDHDIKWKRNEVSCYEQFCKKENLEKLKLKEGDKVCNDNSKNYPVEFQIIETDLKATIQADDLKERFGCVVPAPSTCSSGGFIHELVSDKTVLYIDQSLLVPGSVKSEGAGIIHRACSGKLDLVKYGENAVTFLVPGGVVVKGVLTGVKVGAFTVLKSGVAQVRLKSAIVAGGGLGSVSELFFQQIKIIESAELKPGGKNKIYIWAKDYSGVGGFFRGIGSNIAGARRGTSDHVVLCGVPPADCKGVPKPCEGRDKNSCEPEIVEGGFVLLKQDLGCKLVGDICVSLPQSGQKGFTGRAIDVPVDVASSPPKPCKEFLTDDTCQLQLGCCWKDQCESIEARLGVSKDDPEFKGFSKALDEVGGAKNALSFWDIQSLDIKTLYELPKEIEKKCVEASGKDKCADNWKTLGFRSWKEFGLCEYNDDKNNKVRLIPGTCAIDKINKVEPAYCLVDGKPERVNYPKSCGCKEGYGTTLDKGEIGDSCQKFDSNNINKVELRFYERNRKITAALLDNSIVVTGIKKEDVVFTIEPAGFATLGSTVCEESGSVAYVSCSTQLITAKTGEATITFEYKPKGIKESVNIRFVAEKITDEFDIGEDTTTHNFKADWKKGEDIDSTYNACSPGGNYIRMYDTNSMEWEMDVDKNVNAIKLILVGISYSGNKDVSSDYCNIYIENQQVNDGLIKLPPEKACFKTEFPYSDASSFRDGKIVVKIEDNTAKGCPDTPGTCDCKFSYAYAETTSP